MSPAAFEAISRSRSLPDEKRSAVWNKGPISIDLLEVSTCFLADGVWSVGSVYDASALNHLLSTAIGCGARRFGRPRGCGRAASLSDRREYDRIDSEIGRVSKSSAGPIFQFPSAMDSRVGSRLWLRNQMSCCLPRERGKKTIVIFRDLGSQRGSLHSHEVSAQALRKQRRHP